MLQRPKSDDVVHVMNSFSLNFPFYVSLRVAIFSLKLDDHKQAFDCLSELVYSKQRHFEIHDFDNHLDDISADWSNKALNQLIDNTIKAL